MRTNRDLILLWYEELWNKWNKAIFSEILDEQILFRGSLGETKEGFEGLSEYIDSVRYAFPDFHNHVELILNEGNQAFAKLRYTGTHQGELFGIPATHQVIQYAGAALFTIHQQKIQEVWVLGDLYALRKQLEV